MRVLNRGPRRAGAVVMTAGAVLAAGQLTAAPAQALTAQAAPVHAALPAGAPTLAPTYDAEGPSGVKAKGAFLLDRGAGRTMWGKGADSRLEMASTTKIMTAIVVVTTENANLDRKITVKQAYRDYVAQHGASTADLRTGDKLSARQLLYGLMLPSGCDAAYALADAYGTGDSTATRTKSFIGMMNKKAAELGMRGTKFDSFDGIPKAGNNYSTPQDMAKLASYALGSTNFQAVAKSTKTVQKATNGRTYTWYNTNQLLGSYQGVIGIKTGTGSKAGPCLVFAATRDRRTVVGVILNSSDRYPDATRMLDWAFEQKSPSVITLRSLPLGTQHD